MRYTGGRSELPGEKILEIFRACRMAGWGDATAVLFIDAGMTRIGVVKALADAGRWIQ